MASQHEIANYLTTYGFALPEHHPAVYLPRQARQPLGWRYRQTPTVEELAQELLEDAEFRALQLGNFLGTTDGEIITQAVEMVIPAFLVPDVTLLADGLKLAARLQYEKGQRIAGRVALGALVLFFGAVLRSISRSGA